MGFQSEFCEFAEGSEEEVKKIITTPFICIFFVFVFFVDFLTVYLDHFVLWTWGMKLIYGLDIRWDAIHTM